MHQDLQRCLTLLFCSNLLACSALQTLPPAAWQPTGDIVNSANPANPPNAARLDGLKPGDRLLVVTAASTVTNPRQLLRLNGLQADALVGIDEADGRSVRVPLADIVSLQRYEVDVLRTGLLVLGVVSVVVLVARVLLVAKLLNAGTAASGP